jgi:signal transduction histidine kinase
MPDALYPPNAKEWTSTLDTILDIVIKATGATHGSLSVIENDQATILTRRGYSVSEESVLQQIPPSLKHGLIARAYQTRKPARSDDILIDPEALPALARTRSQVVIPVCCADQALGLIDLQSPHPYAFFDADEDWLLTVGTLAAVPIDQWRCQQAEQQIGGTELIPQQQLLLSAHLAAVSDLAAGLAHEINNPLTTILGYAYLLLRDPALPPVLAEDIKQIVVEGQRIETLVKRFLRFAQPTSSIKQPVAIGEPLLEALEFIRSPLQEIGVRVQLEMPDESPMVLGQPGQIVQVFLDLLQNAIEAMQQTEEPHITINVGQRNGWARVAITDTGCGIMPEHLTRVFEPGFTTKVEHGVSRGIGLGLYAAHTIVQSHRGWIDVASKIGKGSTFTIYLPTIP